MLPSLVLIAEAVFLLERGQTDRQTDATERPTHAGAILQPAWVMIDGVNVVLCLCVFFTHIADN